MNKETQNKLIKDFPKSVVKPAPKGKFGSYVPHHIYTKRLVDVIPGGYDFTYEIVRAKDNSIIGAQCKLYIKDADQTIQEVGDVDVHALGRNITESEVLKLAVSDGIKRCCMRLGIGLELWTGDTSEEEHYAGGTDDVSKEQVKKFNDMVDENPNKAQQLNDVLVKMITDKDKREEYKKAAFDIVVKDGFSKKVSEWTDKQMSEFLSQVELAMEDNKDTTPSEKEIVSDTFGDVKDRSIELQKCPACNKVGNIEDNREKKASDERFNKIPDFACSNYQDKNGCGEGWWLGNEAIPSQWI